MTPHAPFWFRRLSALLPRADRPEMRADFLEWYLDRRRRQPRWRADGWLFAHTTRAVVRLRLDQLGRPTWTGLADDLRTPWRTLRHHPGFALITILTLALGIGANTAIFSVVNGVLLRPLDYPSPDRLVFIASQFPDNGFDQFWMDPPEYVDFRDHNEAFQSVGAYSVGAANLGGETPSRPVRALVTHDLMPTLGVRPLLGRWFEVPDSLPGARPVVMLSWEMWQRTFGGDPAVLGRQVAINGRQTEIIGVMPRGFDVHDNKVELWQILTIDPARVAFSGGSHYLHLIGRLRDDVTFDQAVADTERLLTQWSPTAPNTHAPNTTNHRIILAPLKDDIIGSVQTALVILQAAVAFVLLIACANLANLLLARAESRQREFAVRTALGAARSRLLRQFITEGVVLSLIAAVVGTGLAWAGLQAMITINPDAIPRIDAVTLDRSVLAFTLLTAIITGIVFGLAPMLHLSQRLTMSLRDGGRGSTAGAMRKSLRGALVVSEITLAVILVVGAALLVRSFANLVRVDSGFDQSSLLTFGLVLPGVSYSADRQIAFFSDVQAQLAAIPGVQSVSAMTGLPPTRQVDANTTLFEHIPQSTGPNSVGTVVDFYQIVSVGYTETMGIPLVEGRGFEMIDQGGPPAVLINETLARRYFEDRPALGGKIKPGLAPFAQLPWFTVVGVVKDVRQRGLDADVGTELYVLADQVPRLAGYAYNSMNIVVRSSLPTDTLAPQIRSIVRSLDAGLPIVRMQSMDDVMGRSVARPRFLTILLGIFAGLALVLAALGTYGILSYQVTQRRQEIGIRMALGAQRGQVIWLVMRYGLLLAGAGLLLGVGGAILAGRFLQTLLFGISPNDPTTIVLVVSLILVTAVFACLVPSVRATRVDPLVVLKES